MEENKLKPINERETCKNIKRLMEEKNVTPKQVQEALNLGSLQAVYKWIGPKQNSIPSTENLVLLSQILDCKLEDILVYK